MQRGWLEYQFMGAVLDCERASEPGAASPPNY